MECCETQLIDGDGNFNVSGLDHFVKTVRLGECGLSYVVVAIMGPSISGKSSLLNKLFQTNFREMDAFKGRTQTTKGIWIANSPGIEPCTIVMDLDGGDRRERGEDDTVFERQTTLFALAVSDIILINMCCHDIFKEQAADKPLLKTIFQVMMRLFSPRKMTLLFVIHDKTNSPSEHLELLLREDIQRIWDSVAKPEAHKSTALNELFHVEVITFPNYEEREEQFNEQVSLLRNQFMHSIAPGGLAGDRGGVLPASEFSFSSQHMWKVIKENRELDLPSHKVMIATIRCEEIANEKLSLFACDEAWSELSETVQSGSVVGFRQNVDSILDAYLAEYDEETTYFDEGVRSTRRQHLHANLLKLAHPSFRAVLKHLCSKILENFTIDLDQSLIAGRGFASSARDCALHYLLQFDQDFSGLKVKHANWDASCSREKLRLNIEAHATSIRSTKLSELIVYYKKQLTEELAQPIESLFNNADQSTWASIRKLYNISIEKAISEFTSTLLGFELDSTESDNLKMDLKHHARDVVENKSREETGKILTRLKDRFLDVFVRDNDSLPRVWTGKEDIKKITKDSRIAALKVLSIFAGIRLDEKVDRIESILNSALIDTPTAKEKQNTTLRDPLSSNIWEEIPPENTLISPSQCKSLWKKFIKETDFIVYDKMLIEGALRRKKAMQLLSWKVMALSAIISLACMILSRNRLAIHAVFIAVFMVSNTLRIHRHNITRQFEHVMVAGFLSIISRSRLTPWFSLGAHQRGGHRSMRYVSCRPATFASNGPRLRRGVLATARDPPHQASPKPSTCDYEFLKAHSRTTTQPPQT
ncbi:hypothetical protein KSP40_PGU011969 [Platanthera guangdongensis]|uniref:GB1/RHD3-type G domain-containing protein n=1 Tax=Platanthera guangdongensis TaxID=2320717 RepID=A0ABR2MC85_9ASPA